MEKNKELTEQIIELSEQKQVINTTVNNMTVNMYLDERCGNALNIRDFVNNLTISIDQLCYTKEHGLVKGITNVLLDNFKNMGQEDRPIHCIDTKRHTLKIKDDVWKTQEDDPNIIEEFITGMSNRHMGALSKWTNDNPGWLEPNSKEEDFYLDCIKKIGNPSWSRDVNNKKFLAVISNYKEFKLDRTQIN